MSKIIIAIHGLGNKPPEKILTRWWKKSIYEGLRAINEPRFFFRFELVYWADIMYPEPLDPREKNKYSPCFLEDPYVPAGDFEDYTPSELRKKINAYIKEQIDRIFLNADKSINFSKITDLILHRYFRDLEIYFKAERANGIKSPNLSARDAIRERLARVLKKHRRKDIFLIAHSMGSIVAYDVLAQLDHEVNIDSFITIGSPLGLPVVMSRIYSEQRKRLEKVDFVRTPENVRRQWLNFADLEDKVAIDYELAGDFMPNSCNVGVKDIQIYNNYIHNGKRNPHKAYGYLRSTALARQIHAFLGESALRSFFNEIFLRITEPESLKSVQEF